MYSKYYVPASLEQRLKDVCANNPQYSQLFASWELDKRVFKEILASIPYNYCHFSLHEASHADSIVGKIEMVLGEDRINQLGPTDTWMLLQASYVHDFGMVILDQEVREVWSSKEFQKYIETARASSADIDLRKAADYIWTIDQKQNSQLDTTDLFKEKDWPVTLRRATVLLIADFFRGRHSDLSRVAISKGSNLDVDFSHNGQILPRITKMLGRIAQLHGKNFCDILKLERQDNGIGSDLYHPRFIACMLRLGDLLDLDNGRFSQIQKKVFGELPPSSQAHERKHEAVESFLFTPERIIVKADCPDDVSYREMRRWCDALQSEVNNTALHWSDIVPSGLVGMPPKVENVEISLQGKKDGAMIANLQFNLSQDDAFELLQGANIYENKLAFVRELLQNAVDASKIRLWQDIKEGRFDSIFQWDGTRELLPTDLYHQGSAVDILNQYKIIICIEYKARKQDQNKNDPLAIKFSIKDRGIGISQKDLKNIARAGESWGNSGHWAKLVAEMPRWLQPTGAFGIGMQSVFLVADSLVAYTKSLFDECGKKINFLSRQENGYISVTDPEVEKADLKTGTEFVVEFANIDINTYSGGGYTDRTMRTFDSFIQDTPTVVFHLLEALENYCEDSMFPLEIWINGEKSNDDCFTKGCRTWNTDESDSNGYQYRWLSESSDDSVIPYGVEVFEPKLQSFIEISFPKQRPFYMNQVHKRLFSHGTTTLSFKGMNVKNNAFGNRYLDIKWDIWGLSTKEYLTLNRENLRLENREKRERLEETLNGAICFALKLFYEKLKCVFGIGSVRDEKKINWLALRLLFEDCKMGQKNDSVWSKLESLAADTKIEVVRVQTNASSSDDKQTYANEVMNAKELFSNYKDLAFPFQYNSGWGNIDIRSILISDNPFSIKTVILEQELSDWYSYYKIDQLQMLEDKKFLAVIKEPLQPSSKKVIEVDSKTRKKLILSLASETRGNIPLILGFEDLAVIKLPKEFNYGFRRSRLLIWRYMHIISPITSMDAERIKNEKMTVEKVLCEIIVRNDFKNLVRYVVDNQPDWTDRKRVGEKEVVAAYKKLITEYHGALYEN